MKIETNQYGGATRGWNEGEAPEEQTWSMIPASLDIHPVGRWPLQLREETERVVLERPLPSPRSERVQVSDHWPQVTIIVPSFNNLVFTRMCIESVLINTPELDFELLAVDNGSTDGTRCYLYALARRDPRVRPIFNTTNLGFAAAVNQGLDSGRGEYFVLLNNDTLVPPGALSKLTEYLEDPEIGLVGPVTNRVANEAQIDTSYRTYGEMLKFAERHCRRKDGQVFDVKTTIMFCVAFRRELYEEVGPFDEGYGIGLFEDEDYSRRVQQLGLRLVCAEDAFVHHFGEATTGEITEEGGYGRLFHINRHRYQEKWGIEWVPHRHRVSADYCNSVRHFRRAVEACTPDLACVLVVSRGDSALLEFQNRSASHFPCNEDGAFLGYYPATSQEAVDRLERMRQKGAQFLAFPDSSRWWLDHYQGLQHHLTQRYRVRFQDAAGLIFDLRTNLSASDSARVQVSEEDPNRPSEESS